MISSSNEWGRLRKIIVGSALGANWPSADPVFAQENKRTTWKHTPVPSGAVPRWIQEETEQDLEDLVKTLILAGVEVHRPYQHNFATSNGFYNYCPRDRVLVADEVIVDTAMMYPCRDQELAYIQPWFDDAKVIGMPRDQHMVCDAANICRLGDDWLYLLSKSGNWAALQWLIHQFPNKRIWPCDFYAGVHIDSTIVPLRDGVVMLNAERVNPDNLPDVLRGWQHIWIDQCQPQQFYEYPYASAWIGMNVLSIDSHTVIVDREQHGIIKQLEQQGFTVIPLQLRHSRTLGGGFHCVTLDLWREDD